jgi:hypothetical protein
MTATWQRGPRDFVDPYVVALAIIDAAVAASVDADLTGTPAVRELPATMPSKIVQVRIDGGTSRGVVDVPRVSYRVWHTTPGKRAKLAALVRGAFLNPPLVAGGAKVSRCVELLRPTDIPDPEDSSVSTYFGRVELDLRP